MSDRAEALAYPGEIIAGRYRVEAVLGRGGMGTVYEATQLQLNRRVAIKLMHPQFGAQPEARARFEREARVSAALRHRHTIEIHDFGEDAGRLFLAMERLEGEPLGLALERSPGPLPLPRSLEIARQIADALAAAHALSLIHRDLKPDNLFLERADYGADRVVVVDFGLAFIAEREDAGRMTTDNVIMGTPLYISPEQISMKDVGPWSDIYSFGCILYQLVTHTTPFEGAPMALLSMHAFATPAPPSQRNQNVYVPRALEELIGQMMSKRAAERPSALAIRTALEQLVGALSERERGRGHEALMERAARMIDAPAPPPVHADPDEVRVVITQPLGEELALGLRVNGFTPVLARSVAEIPPDTAAVFVGGTDLSAVQHLLPLGYPVLVEADSANPTLIQQLLEAGVADVISPPARAEELSRKLRRAVRKSQRRRRPS